MKKGRKHMVPLPHQAVTLLRELETITGAGAHLFPNSRRPREVMSEPTINRALEHMGFKPGVFTGHDFRATASTMLHEMGYRSELVEMQLAHASTSKVAAAYNHAAYLDERTAMMQAWADWIDGIEAELGPSSSEVLYSA
jgi:integrase